MSLDPFAKPSATRTQIQRPLSLAICRRPMPRRRQGESGLRAGALHSYLTLGATPAPA